MNVSTRGVKAQASPIRRLAPYADAAVRSGAKVYYLNIGQPDIPTPEIVMERLKTYPGKYIPYSPSANSTSSQFRQACSADTPRHTLPWLARNAARSSIRGGRPRRAGS